jgi:hypothetical protein
MMIWAPFSTRLTPPGCSTPLSHTQTKLKYTNLDLFPPLRRSHSPELPILLSSNHQQCPRRGQRGRQNQIAIINCASKKLPLPPKPERHTYNCRFNVIQTNCLQAPPMESSRELASPRPVLINRALLEVTDIKCIRNTWKRLHSDDI